MSKETFDVYCPSCNLLVEAKVIARGFGDYRADAVCSADISDAEYHGEHYSVALCRRCNGPFLVRESVFGVPGEFETITDESVLFPAAAAPAIHGLPPSVGRALDQAHRSFATGSYDACALMCRRGLEALARTLSAKGGTLAQRLADLHATGHIDARLLGWAHGVRLVGNEAAHDVEAAVSPEDARDILELTEALLMYVFSLDAKFRAFEARRSDRTNTGNGGAA